MALTCIILLCLISQMTYYLYGYLGDGKLRSGEEFAADKTVPSQVENTNQKQQRSFSKELPELILVNKSQRLAKEYEPNDLIPIKGIYLREIAASALVKMLNAAEDEKLNRIVPYSGYRSYATQSAVYSNKIASLRADYGELAEREAAKLVAPPGSSEHQTGLAVDLTITDFLDYEYVLNYDFAYTKEGQWLRKNVWKYGFILRYDESKEDKTGFSYEPWHFRYVGLEHAKAIYEGNLCLEEYLN